MHPIIRIILETVAVFAVLGMMIYGVLCYIDYAEKRMFEAEPSIECPVDESRREDNYEINYLTGGINGKLHEHGITRLVSTQEVLCYRSEQSLQAGDYILVVESKKIHDVFQDIRDKYFSQEKTDVVYFDEEKTKIRIRYEREIFIDRSKCKEDCDTAFKIPNFRKVYPGLDKLTVFESMDRKSITNYFFYIYLSVDYESPIIIFSWGR